jgi:hypothetical protein
MIPVNQFILGSSDPLLYPSEKMTNSIDEQIAFLQSQKQAINEAYRYLMMLNLVMFMLQLMLNIMIMLNYLKNGLVVI